MPEVITPADNNDTATRTAGQPAADPLRAERERMREIRALARQHDLPGEMVDRAIDDGTTLDAFRAQVLERVKPAGNLRPAESPDIGLSRHEVERYSFCRVLLAASDPANAAKLAPFELEVSRAAQDKLQKQDKIREAGITVPIDVLARGLDVNDAMAGVVARNLIQRAMQRGADAQYAYRDLVVGTASAGGNLVATELLGSSFIDLLRNAMVLDALGVTWFRDLNGNIAIPSQSGGATAYWVAESGAPTESQQTIGQVTMTPKTVGAFTDYSRRLLLQSSLDVEAFVRADLAATLGQAIQLAALNGSGSSNQPTGLLNTSGIGSVAGGTNGLAPTYEHMVDLESGSTTSWSTCPE